MTGTASAGLSRDVRDAPFIILQEFAFAGLSCGNDDWK